MSDQVGECIYETRSSATRRQRIFYWTIAIIGPLAFFVFAIWQGGGLALAAFSFVAAWGVMLLNGFRMVIGVRVYSDRLCIVTPLADREFPWSRVTIKKYPAIFFRTDVYVDNEVWPFMLAFQGEQVAVETMEKVQASVSGGQ